MEPVLVSDDACGLCTRWADLIGANTAIRPVGFSTLSPERGDRLPANADRCVHLLADGRVYSCGEAVEAAIARLDFVPSGLQNPGPIRRSGPYRYPRAGLSPGCRAPSGTLHDHRRVFHDRLRALHDHFLVIPALLPPLDDHLPDFTDRFDGFPDSAGFRIGIRSGSSRVRGACVDVTDSTYRSRCRKVRIVSRGPASTSTASNPSFVNTRSQSR